LFLKTIAAQRNSTKQKLTFSFFIDIKTEWFTPKIHHRISGLIKKITQKPTQ